jgi:long-chain-fatty-acid--CoA ligase ACSBG
MLKKKELNCYFVCLNSHIAGQGLDCYFAVAHGFTVYFANPDVFRGSLAKTLVYAKPTLFFAVPRVWEKLQDKIMENLVTLSKTKAKIFEWATKVTLAQKRSEIENKPKSTMESIGAMLADKLILSKIKRMLGLDQTLYVASGAAPLSQKTTEFFMGLGFVILETYGMSESTGGVLLSTPDKYRFGSVGPINEFNKIKIRNPDQNGVGEICIMGRNVFMGYLNSPNKTQDIFDTDGYLCTGDLGRIDDDGFLFVTGRIKELIITAGGENVAPIPIEDAVKEELPGIVSSCMVVGDKKQFLSILITLKVG